MWTPLDGHLDGVARMTFSYSASSQVKSLDGFPYMAIPCCPKPSGLCWVQECFSAQTLDDKFNDHFKVFSRSHCSSRMGFRTQLSWPLLSSQDNTFSSCVSLFLNSVEALLVGCGRVQIETAERFNSGKLCRVFLQNAGVAIRCSAWLFQFSYRTPSSLQWELAVCLV